MKIISLFFIRERISALVTGQFAPRESGSNITLLETDAIPAVVIATLPPIIVARSQLFVCYFKAVVPVAGFSVVLAKLVAVLIEVVITLAKAIAT
jgi:hypothetical protein